MRSIAADPASGFHGTLDAWKVYPVGHSAGGGTAVSLLSRPDVPSAVALASGFMVSSLTQGTFTPAFDKPIMWVGGRDDRIDPIDDVRLAFSRSAGERKLVEITSGHLNGFTDICEIGDGGIAALASRHPTTHPGLPPTTTVTTDAPLPQPGLATGMADSQPLCDSRTPIPKWTRLPAGRPWLRSHRSLPRHARRLPTHPLTEWPE